LFRFNRNIETLCFGKEAKKPKQTVSKQTENNEKYEKNEENRKNPKFSVKNCKICSLSNCFGWSSVCFGSIETSKLCFGKESETTETNVLFRILLKLVTVPVSVVSNQN
jgi:hypothetical protein